LGGWQLLKLGLRGNIELDSVGLVGMVRRLRKLVLSRGEIELNDRFYNGGERENGILTRAYDAVAKHVHTVFKVSFVIPKFRTHKLID
jgi:hypothetical protein